MSWLWSWSTVTDMRGPFIFPLPDTPPALHQMVSQIQHFAFVISVTNNNNNKVFDNLLTTYTFYCIFFFLFIVLLYLKCNICLIYAHVKNYTNLGAEWQVQTMKMHMKWLQTKSKPSLFLLFDKCKRKSGGKSYQVFTSNSINRQKLLFWVIHIASSLAIIFSLWRMFHKVFLYCSHPGSTVSPI